MNRFLDFCSGWALGCGSRLCAPRGDDGVPCTLLMRLDIVPGRERAGASNGGGERDLVEDNEEVSGGDGGGCGILAGIRRRFLASGGRSMNVSYGAAGGGRVAVVCRRLDHGVVTGSCETGELYSDLGGAVLAVTSFGLTCETESGRTVLGLDPS